MKRKVYTLYVIWQVYLRAWSLQQESLRLLHSGEYVRPLSVIVSMTISMTVLMKLLYSCISFHTSLAQPVCTAFSHDH